MLLLSTDCDITWIYIYTESIWTYDNFALYTESMDSVDSEYTAVHLRLF